MSREFPTGNAEGSAALQPVRIERALRRASGGLITGRTVHWLNSISILLASVIFILADADGSATPLRLAVEIGCITAVIAVGTRYSRRFARRMDDVPAVSPLLVAIVLLSLAWEPVGRWLTGTGRPFELMVMNCLKNLLLGLAFVGCWPRYSRMAMIVSVFLVTFAGTLTSEPAIHMLIALFTVTAIAWLTMSYWDSIRPRLLPQKGAGLPGRRMVVAGLVLVVGLASVGTGQNQVASALRGFMPSSGGTGHYDPFARGGVNDGDAMVAGSEDIKSFGPIEDAPFADSEKPSLYDVFNDAYDEPVRKIQNQDRAIALPPELLVETKLRMAEMKKVGREFSTLRKQRPAAARPIHDIQSAALMYVAGRAPIHLRLELYDLFDGIDWFAESVEERGIESQDVATRDPQKRISVSPDNDFERPDPGSTTRGDHLVIRNSAGRPWLKLPDISPTLSFFCSRESHALKIINLDTNVIPTPLRLNAIHIDRVDRADMFASAGDRLVRLQRERLPSLVAIHLASDIVDRGLIDSETSRMLFSSMHRPGHVAVPDSAEMEAIANLAREWTGSVPRGWGQVQAISERLRIEYVLDRDMKPPHDCESPVHHFLFESRRGPDYLFATAAALMLRSLDYPTRVVSGFYVSPEHYDPASRHTPVRADDVHFWCETFVAGNIWLTVEPTPGYQVADRPPTRLEQALAALVAAGMFLAQHTVAVFTVAIGATLVWFRRYRVLDALLTCRWYLNSSTSGRARVLQTVRLFDRRLSWCGRPRPASSTVLQWVRSHAAQTGCESSLVEFAQLADWAAFAPVDHQRVAGTSISAIESVCRQVINQLPYSELQDRRRTVHSPETTGTLT